MFIGFEQKYVVLSATKKSKTDKVVIKTRANTSVLDCIEDYCIKEYDKLSVFEKADKLSMEEIEDISERKLHKCDYHKEVTG